ncbi:MAG TPA: hypothetical protein VGD40_20265 [Chryseosolibacter sp.]
MKRTMSQQNEDSIDRFFRKAVVQQDKTFMERDWARMEKMLDEQSFIDASRSRGKARSLITKAVVTAVLTLFFVADNNLDNDIPENSVQMQAAVGVLGPLRGVKTEGPTADLHSSAKDSNAAVEIIAKSHVQDGGTSVTKHALNASREPFTRGQKDFTKEESIVTLVNHDSRQRSEDVRIRSDEPREALSLLEDIGEPPVAPTEPVRTEPIKADSIFADVKSEGMNEVVDEVVKEEEKNQSKLPRFSITGLVSPDFSTTSLSKYSRPSNVFGLLLGYRIMNRITIMTGVTKGLKRYEGYGSEYTPPEGYWRARTNGVIPDEVEGKCGIIEVPILIQADVLQQRKSRLFVSAGVSSYFMRSEHYQYTFNEPNPGAAESWTAKEPTRYLFKIGHLSAGYDHVIANKFTIGIEPFLKVPFEGIGWTDINLYSTGAYINLRYNILVSRNE